MKYCIIDRKTADAYGIQTVTHRTFDGGNRLVVNENELANLNVGSSEEQGGAQWTLLTLSEVENIIKKAKNK